MSTQMILLLVLTLLLFGVAIAIKTQIELKQLSDRNEGPLKNRPLPYALNKSILTPPEVNLAETLQAKARGRYTVIPQQAFITIVGTTAPAKERVAWKNRVIQKRCDFLLCEPETYRPLCVIELDDSTHNRPVRKRRDAFVNALCEDVGLPMVRCKLRREGVDEDRLMKLIERALEADLSTSAGA